MTGGASVQGETELSMALMIQRSDGDCQVALLDLARRFDELLGILDQLTDCVSGTATAINLHAAHEPVPPIPLRAAPYQHQAPERRCTECGEVIPVGALHIEDSGSASVTVRHVNYQCPPEAARQHQSSRAKYQS